MADSKKVDPGRILVCGTEISGMLGDCARALGTRWDVASCCLEHNQNFPLAYTYGFVVLPIPGTGILDRISRKVVNTCAAACRALLFAYLIFRFKTWIFFWCQSFLPWNLDRLILRLLGKRVITVTLGSEIRFLPIQYHWERKVKGYWYYPEDDEQAWKECLPERAYQAGFLKFWRTRVSELAGDVISLRTQATFQKKFHYFFRFAYCGEESELKEPGEKIRIVHAPTNRVVKGTRYVFDAMKILERKHAGKFEFVFLEKVPNSQVMAEFRRSDIVIDQPGPWIARVAIEAMASGCAVVGGNSPEYLGVDLNCPVIQFECDGEKLADSIGELISDRKRLSALKSEGQEFYRKYYRQDAFCDWFQDVLAGRATRQEVDSKYRNVLLDGAISGWQRMWLRFLY